MSLVYKKIASYAINAADSNETMYTVASGERVVGQLMITNTSTTNNRTVRVATVGNGDTLGPEHYHYYDATLTPEETITLQGLTLGAGDAIVVRSDAISDVTPGTGIVFHLFGELDDNVI